MSLRVKLVVALVLLSLTATITVGVWSYFGTRSRLDAELNRSLDDGRIEIAERYDSDPVDLGLGDDLGRYPPRSFEQIVVQVLHPDGTHGFRTGALPVDATDRRLAQAATPASWVRRDRKVGNERYRVDTIPIGNGRGAFEIGRSLAETDRLLDSLRTRLLLSIVLVAVTAAAFGWLIARQVTRRIEQLTRAAEHVGTTGQLDVSAPVGGRDEAGRLAHAFNGMLAALGRSKEAQQRLVEDAGHELRTPLTSLRTNISVLRRRSAELTRDEHTRLLDDLDGEAKELTLLINELVELATDQRDDEPLEDIALGPLVERMAERTRRRRARSVVVHADDTIVRGRPLALERVVGNLLDNAAKFDTTAGDIEVDVTHGRVTVADRGPGIAEQDRSHVFDRFYRAVDARSRPGSGLGLAIVRDIVEAHGGSVFASDRGGDGPGATVGFELPTIE